MSKISLIIVEVVRLPVPSPSDVSARAQRLLRLGNAWLQRRAAGARDTLVLLAIGATDEGNFRSALLPFGLGAAETAVIDEIEEGADLGAAVGEYLDSHLSSQHSGAVPLASWPEPYRKLGYPDDVWWLGMECFDSDSCGWSASIASAAPSPFSKQAATWEAMLDFIADLQPDQTAASQIRAGLLVASLARWLTGFSAASGDQFFDFDYGDVPNAFGLDPFLLGFEAGRHHLDDLEGDFDDGDGDALQRAAVKALLCSDRYLDTDAIRHFFTGSLEVFFSLYTSIWPKREMPAGDACSILTGGEDIDMGEIDNAWRFAAHDDWSSIDDSD